MGSPIDIDIINYSTDEDKHRNDIFNDELIHQTHDIKYPCDACFTPFVSKSINNNNYDSLYLKNIFNNSAKYNNINNYNNKIPLISGGDGEKEYFTKFISMKCDFNVYSSEFDNIDKKNKIVNFDNTLIPTKLIASINNDLKHIDLDSGQDMISFFIENSNINNENCIIVILTYSGYNIYLILSDKWLFKKNKFKNIFTKDQFDTDSGPQYLLFDNS